MKPAKTVISTKQDPPLRLIEKQSRESPSSLPRPAKPVVRVTAIDAPLPLAVRRTGFLAGQISVPRISDRLGADRNRHAVRMAGNEAAPSIPTCSSGERANPTTCRLAARAMIEEPEHQLVFSAASLWEIAIKNSLGRTDFRADPALLAAACSTTAIPNSPSPAGTQSQSAGLPLCTKTLSTACSSRSANRRRAAAAHRRSRNRPLPRPIHLF